MKIKKKFDILVVSIFVVAAMASLAFVIYRLPQDRASAATTTVVEVTQDTYVDKSVPAGNYGTADVLRIDRPNDADYKMAYLHFNLAALNDRTVDCNGCSAILRVDVPLLDRNFASSNGHYFRGIKILPYDGWSEDTLTYSDILQFDNVTDHYEYPVVKLFMATSSNAVDPQNAPSIGQNSVIVNESVSDVTFEGSNRRTGTLEIDLTDQLDALMGQQFTIMIENYRSGINSNEFYFYSKEHASRLPPQLEMTHEAAPAAPPVPVSANPGFAIGSGITKVDFSTVYLNQHLTGMHKWRGVSDSRINPNYIPGKEDYDRFYWGDIEGAQGNYDFSAIDDKIAAMSAGQKYAFRLRMMDDNITPDGNGGLNQRGGQYTVPTYIRNEDGGNDYMQTCESATVPNWTNPALIARVDALMTAVANRYDGDPRIAFIDIGLAGRWGEWNGVCFPSNDPAGYGYIDMHTDKFQNTQLVMLTDDEGYLKHALQKPTNAGGYKVGVRSDSWTFASLHSSTKHLYKYESWHLVKERWKDAPMLGEFGGGTTMLPSWPRQFEDEVTQWHISTVGNGNIASSNGNYVDTAVYFDAAARQLGARIIPQRVNFDGAKTPGSTLNVYLEMLNEGNAPPYGEWDVILHLDSVDLGSPESYELTLSGIDPRDLLPTTNRITAEVTPHTFTTSVVIPAQLAAATYRASISITDTTDYSGFPECAGGFIDNCERGNFKMFINDTDEVTQNDPNDSDGVYPLGNILLIDGGGQPNEPPVASADSFSGDEDTVINGNVSLNDSDPEGHPLSYTVFTGPNNGNLQLNSSGTFTYTPNLNSHGVDTFTYTVSDGFGGTDTALVTLTINSVNDDPVAQGDDFTMDQGGVLNGDVSLNDSDADDDTLTYSVNTIPTHGVLNLNSEGSFTYTPNNTYAGSDSFIYNISDGNGGADSATVSITINPVNSPPLAQNDSFQTNRNVGFSGDVSLNDIDNDDDPLTYAITIGVLRGSLNFGNDGTFTYTPEAGYYGSDSFSYEASDGNGGSDSAEVSITINFVNIPPIAVNDSYTVNEDSSIQLNPLANDSDPDGHSLAISNIANPPHGTVSNSLLYTPDANYFGTDSFNYTISDGNGGSDTATITITVNPVSDPISVNAGPDVTVEVGTDVRITATLTDPDNSNDVTYKWSVVEGNPGKVNLVSKSARSTLVRSTQPNVYELEIEAVDGDGNVSVDTMNLTVDEIYEVHNDGDGGDGSGGSNGGDGGVVNTDSIEIEGFGVEVVSPGTVKVKGSIESTFDEADIVIAWRKISGPGEVTFVTPEALETEIIFSESGRYVVELRVSSGGEVVLRRMNFTVDIDGADILFEEEFVDVSSDLPSADRVEDSDWSIYVIYVLVGLVVLGAIGALIALAKKRSRNR